MKWVMSILLFVSTVGYAQTGGIALKASINIGSHIQGVGLGIHGYLTFNHIQCTAGNDISFYLKSLGGRKCFWENRSYAGLFYGGGKAASISDFEWGNAVNYSKYTHQFGYSYLFYADNARTSQSSGAFAFEAHRNRLYFENDFFAGQGKDRFRTANLVFRHRELFYALTFGVRIWTGETSGVGAQQALVKGKTSYFKDLSNLSYGQTSHGILYVGTEYLVGLGQVLKFQCGMDAEGVRNVFQNNIGHAACLHLDKSKAVKYPRLDGFGNPTFERGSVKSSETFFQLSLGGE
jgi:hypothetical protein